MAFWAALPAIAGIGSALLGASSARGANRAAAEAAKPQPFDRHETRQPWEPARNYLEEALGMARGHYDQAIAHRPPPTASTSGIRGASPALREIAERMSDRAANSTFIPDMQAGLTDFLKGPNPMMQGVYDRAMSYDNPMLRMLTERGMSGQGSFDQGSGQIQDLIGNLMAGQRQLGAPPPQAGAGPPGHPGPQAGLPPQPGGPPFQAGPPMAMAPPPMQPPQPPQPPYGVR